MFSGNTTPLLSPSQKLCLRLHLLQHILRTPLQGTIPPSSVGVFSVLQPFKTIFDK